MEEIVVRKAASDDAATLFRLICALADFESLDPPNSDARERLERDGWPRDGRPPRFTAWLAEVNDGEGHVEAVGYAITLFTYSSFLAQPTLYIEDIFVVPFHRRRSVGSILMRRLVQEAWETGCGRMEWIVLDWNIGAQQFYQRLGAEHMSNWHYYRLRREQIPAILE